MARVFGGEQQRSFRWILAYHCDLGKSLHQLFFLTLVMVTSTSVLAMVKLTVEIKLNHYSSEAGHKSQFRGAFGVTSIFFTSVLNCSKLNHPRIITKSDGNIGFTVRGSRKVGSICGLNFKLQLGHSYAVLFSDKHMDN